MGSNTYTEEHRRETADCIISTGMPAAEVSRELGLNPKTTNGWVKGRHGQLAGKPNLKAKAAEVRAMQKRIRELEMENAFLKKAAAFFAKDQAWPSAIG